MIRSSSTGGENDEKCDCSPCVILFAVMPPFGPPSASPTSPILCLVFLQVSRYSSHKLWVGGVKKKLQPKLGQKIIPSKRTASTWRDGAIGTSALSLEFLALRLEVIWHCVWK